MVISENRRADELRRYSAARSEAAAPYLDFFIERYREAFDAEIDAFVTSVEQGEAPQVGFEDGRRALTLAEAAMKSAVAGPPGEGRGEKRGRGGLEAVGLGRPEHPLCF